MKRLMTLMTAALACACADPGAEPVGITTPQGLNEMVRCAPLGVDLVPEGFGVVVHGAIDAECATDMIAELTSADGRRLALGEMPIDPETGRFGVRLEYFEEPPLDMPLTLWLWGGEAAHQIELRAIEGPEGIELIAPTPEAPVDMTGAWMLSSRRPGTAEDTAPAYARVFQDGNFIEVTELCDPERRIATGWIEGEHLALFDAESEQPLGEGSASPYHMQTFFESAEAVDVLEGVRLEAFDCETALPPVQATPFMPRQHSELTMWTGLNPFNGFVAAFPNDVMERTVLWPNALPGGTFIPVSKPNGMDHLMAAAKTPWPAVKRKINEQTQPTECIDPANQNASIPCPAPNSGAAPYQECVPTRVTGQAVMELANRVLLTPDNDVYPGALLQGRTVDNGNFAPVNVPRGGTTLTLSGPSLANPSIAVNTVDFASVEQARQTLVRRPMHSTGGRLAITTEAVHSFDDLMVQAGAHVKWGAGAFTAKFNFQNNSKVNSVLVKFDQELYRLVAARPSQAVAAFRDGGRFNDPDFNIGAHNRPVFVSEVGYGRQLFLLVQSKHTVQDIKASLKVAVGQNSGNASVKNKQVLKDSSITFVALGGDAQLAAAPLNAIGSGGNVFKAVVDTAANLRGLSTSPTNAAVPVAFTLTDLLRGDKLRAAYSVSHTRRDCVARDGRPFKVELDIRSINEGLDVWISRPGTAKNANADMQFSLLHPTKSGYGSSLTVDLTPRLGGAARRIDMEHHNYGCFLRWADVRLNVDGTRRFRHRLVDNGWGHCGVYARASMLVDPSNGSFSLGSYTR